MAVQLDNQSYSKTGLIEIKVPLRLPYATNWKEFQRCDGVIQFNGTQYNYVERKLYNDTMTFVCIPNEKQTELSNAKNEYAKQMSDAQTTSGNKKDGSSSVIKISVTEYNQQVNDYNISSLSSLQLNYFLQNDRPVAPSFIHSILQPPEQAVS